MRASQKIIRSRSIRAFSLVEVMIAMAIAGLLLAAVAMHLIETSVLSIKTAHTLEHVRNARELVGRFSSDVRNAQAVTFHPSFADRSIALADGQTGNYVVLHRIDSSGTVSRTIGYYLLSDGADWKLFRHDSERGDSAAGSLPGTGTAGLHAIATSVVQLPQSAGLFTRLRDNGVIVRGEFGKGEGATLGRRDYMHFAACTRS